MPPKKAEAGRESAILDEIEDIDAEDSDDDSDAEAMNSASETHEPDMQQLGMYSLVPIIDCSSASVCSKCSY